MKLRNLTWKGRERLKCDEFLWFYEERKNAALFCAFVRLECQHCSFLDANFGLIFPCSNSCWRFFFSFRFTNDGLKRLCEIFDLEKKGKRVCLRIMYCCVTKAKAADCFHFKLIHIECKIICLIFFICVKLQLFTLSSFAHGLTLKLWRILNLLRNGLLHQKPLH